MEYSVARQRYTTRRPANGRRRKRALQPGGVRLKKLLLFQSVICIILFLIIIIAKSINITATNFITDRIRYMLSHNVELKSILTYADNLAADIRNSIVPGSVEKAGADGLTASLEGGTSTDTLTSGITQRTAPGAAADQGTDESQSTHAYQGTYASQSADAAPVSEEKAAELQSAEATLSASVDNDVIPSVLSASSDEETGSLSQMTAPVDGLLDTPFGEISGNTAASGRIHNGIDIAVDGDSSVIAALDGEIYDAGMSPEYGAYIRIHHENDMQTVYAYCSSLNVQKGDYVKKGDVIARIGNLGISAGSHLHFEVWESGNAVDPLGYISVSAR